jgi:hypothetical protein
MFERNERPFSHRWEDTKNPKKDLLLQVLAVQLFSINDGKNNDGKNSETNRTGTVRCNSHTMGKKNGADQAMTSPPLEERSIMMSAEIRIFLIGDVSSKIRRISRFRKPKYSGFFAPLGPFFDYD